MNPIKIPVRDEEEWEARQRVGEKPFDKTWQEEFYARFVELGGIRATTLNDEHCVIGKACDVMEFIESLFEKQKKDILEEVYEIKKRFKCVACEEKVSSLSHTQTCVAIQEIIDKLTKPTPSA